LTDIDIDILMFLYVQIEARWSVDDQLKT